MKAYKFKLPLWPMVIVLVLIGGCNESPSESPSVSSTSKTITLRFGHDMPVDSSQHEAALRFAKLVKQRSAGQIEVSIYPNQQLGTDPEMIEMAREGELDITLPPTAKLSTHIPMMQLVDLPFLCPKAEDCYRLLDGTVGHAMLAKLSDYGLVGVTFWESGFKQFTANRPLKKLKDFEGMKFRIMRSQVLQDQFHAWGADTLVVNFGKTRAALEKGVVDGQENPLVSIYNMKFYQAQSHLVLSRHGYLAQVMVFSKKIFDDLPSDLQKILISTAKEITLFQRKEAQQREIAFLESIRNSGTEIIELPSETRDALREAVKPILEKNRTIIGTDILEQALQIIDETREYGDDELVIAIDADFAGSSRLSGLAIKRGVELAVNELNKTGGVLGKRLVVTARDNSMISARGIDNIERFSKIPNLVAVVGGISSPVALSELDLIHEKKIIFLDPWAAATHIVSNGRNPNYVFRVSVRDEYAAGFLVEKTLEITKSVGVFLVNNGWGRSNHKAIRNALTEKGLEPTHVEWFDWGDTSHREKVDAMYKAGVEAIIYIGNSVEAAKIVRIIAEREQPLPIISHWGITGGFFPELAGNALDRVDLRVLQTFSFINNKNKQVKDIVKRYKENYGIKNEKEIVAPVGTAHAYDLIHMLAKAINKAGTYESDKVRVALEKLRRHDGLVRTYSPPFREGHHDALDASDFFLAKYQDEVLVPLK